MEWDPQQYARYADERGRPFVELLARVPATEPAAVVDLGCGPGPLTRLLLDRWPTAAVTGVDASLEMVVAARQHAVAGRLEFLLGDVAEWQPREPVDVVIANAVLQWVPSHLSLLPRFASWLRPAGVLAFQVPDNFSEPSHTLLRDLRLSPRWRDRLGVGADRGAAVERPDVYLRALVEAGLEPDVWQTTYLHVLPGEDAVLEWVKGTALRPVLALLEDPDQRRDFLAEYAAALRAAYAPRPEGTLFPFRRTFAVGRRTGQTA